MAQSTENEGVIWHFKPLHTPHFGGVHETIIKEAKRAANVMFSSPQVLSRIVVTRTPTETTFSNKPYILLLSLIFLTFERLSRTHQTLFTNCYLTKFLCKFWKLKINLSNHCPLRHSSHADWSYFVTQSFSSSHPLLFFLSNSVFEERLFCWKAAYTSHCTFSYVTYLLARFFYAPKWKSTEHFRLEGLIGY